MRRMMLVALATLALAGVAFSQGKSTADSKEELSRMHGFWHGSWGGGPRADGVVFQPVLAEAVFEGDWIRLHGFRSFPHLEGTIRIDPRRHEVAVTPAKLKDGAGESIQEIKFAYSLKQNELTLTDSEGSSVSLSRESTSTKPQANISFELAVANGIDAQGNLNVTDQVVVRSGKNALGQEGETRYAPRPRRVMLQSASIYLIQEQGWKKIGVEEIRPFVKNSAPVALAYRPSAAVVGTGTKELWKEFGAASPESEPALNTISKALRPGTVLFVLSAEENGPQP